MPINSRSKGKRGELNFVAKLRSHNLEARRGQQFAGGGTSPDVICPDLSGVHFEIKRTQQGNPYQWLAQAERDCGTNLPVVAHKRNGKKWIAIMDADQLIELLIQREAQFL